MVFHGGLWLGLVAAAAACSARSGAPKRGCPDVLRLAQPSAVSTDNTQWCISEDGGRAQWTEYFPGDKGRKQVCPYGGLKASGTYRSWHRNGQIKIEGLYARGEKIGKWTQFNERGGIVARADYRFGRFVAGAPVGIPARCEDSVPPSGP